MLHEELSHKILQACFEVSNELGIGFLESVYKKSLLLALRQKGLIADPKLSLEVKFRGVMVGEFYPDVFVEEKIILELKTIAALTKEHQAQLINYLKATGAEVGMLINFGNPKLEYRRFENKFLKTNSIRDIFSE